MVEPLNLKIVLTLTIGFGLAALFGYLSHRVKLSPILGYLFAGYLIGPFSPGFVADLQLAEQLAEVGVILMMFGVGMHFKWQDLVHTSGISIPGAIGQTLVTTLACILLTHYIGWTLEAGIVFGLAIGVASTVVLMRVLSDYNILSSPQGHIAVGWLIVEDIITVAALLLIPAAAASLQGDGFSMQNLIISFGIVLVKFLALAVIMFTVGLKIVSYFFTKVVLTQSHELFTLTVLALTLIIAVGSTLLFQTSIALGAFIAGMVIGQTHVRRQASSNAMPIKDAFVVIFFLSVGMLFNPVAISENPLFFSAVFGIILLLKPLAAILITLLLQYPFKTALTVAIGLAQIGEFSFILSEQALNLKILPDAAYDLIVAAAIVTISINPLLFKLAKLGNEPPKPGVAA